MPPLLKVSGTTFQTSGSCGVTLRGVNLPSLEWGMGEGPPSGAGGNIFTSLDYIISNWKANIIRLPLNEGYWNNFQYSYRQQVDDIVNDAGSKGVYVILDLHLLRQNDTTQSAMPDAGSAAFWTNVAGRYKNTTNVLFGLYNEPFPGDFTTWSNGSGGPGIPALLQAVRAAEAGGVTHICLEGGIDYAWDLRGVPAPGDANVAYDCHYYNGKNQSYVTGTGRPIFFGEFGPPDTSGATWDNNAITWINSMGGNGTAWSFNVTSTPILISDWSFTATAWHGTPVKNWITGLAASGCSPGPGPYGVTPVPPTATPAAGACELVDNLEDGDLANQVGGMWFTFRWTSVNGAAVTPWAALESCPDGTPCPFISDSSANAQNATAGSLYAAHVTGSYTVNGPTTYAGFAIGTELSGPSTNWTNMTLISFDVKVDKAGVTLRCNAANPKISYGPVTYKGSQFAGSGGGTDNQYGFNFIVPTANTWLHITRTKNAFECGDWGPNSCPPPIPRGQTSTFITQAQALTQVLSIQWEIQGAPASFGYWVDNVCLSGLPTSTPTVSSATSTPTRTATPSPTNTTANTNTPTRTATATATRTGTSTPTNTPSNTATRTPTNTVGNTNTATNSPTRTATPSPTNTATSSPTRTATNSPTNTLAITNTATNSPTRTPSNTPTNSPSNTATRTPSNTPTPTVPGANSATATNSPTVTPTRTPTNSPTVTPTHTPSNTPTPTIPGANSATATNSPTRTPSNTPTNSPTNSPTRTPSNTPTPTIPGANSATATNSPTRTPSNTPTNSPSVTPTSTSSNTATPTVPGANSATATNSPTRTPSSTPTNSPSNTATNSPSRTATGTPTNTPLITNTATKSPTMTPTTVTVQLVNGPSVPPNANTAPGSANVPLLEFQLTNPGTVPAAIDTLALTASGSGNDATAITSVNIYLDNNNNGIVDGGDTLLDTATYATNNGTLVLNLGDNIGAGSTSTYLVTYTFSGAAPNGTTFTASFDPAADLTGSNSNGALNFSGAAESGATLTIVGLTATPTKTVTLTPTSTPETVLISNGSISDTTQLTGMSNIPVLEFTAANTGNGTANISSITLHASGSGNDASGIDNVAVYLDSNNNGIVDAGDTLLATGVYGSDNGTLTLAVPGSILPASANHYLVVYSLASGSAPGTYQASLTLNTDLAGTNGITGQAVLVSGAPINGAVLTAQNPTPTVTSTPTQSPTGTFTITATPTATLAISSEPVVYPNPVVDDTKPVFVAVNLPNATDQVTVQIFTVAFRKVQEVTVYLAPGMNADALGGTDGLGGASAKKWKSIPVPLTDKSGAKLARGLYYVVIKTPQGRSVGKMLLTN